MALNFPKGIYVSADNIFAENSIGDEDSFVYSLGKAGWIVDFALVGNLEINKNRILQSTFKIGYEVAGERVVRRLDSSQFNFLSLYLHKNPYDDPGFNQKNHENIFTTALAYPVLKIISILKDFQSDFQKDISIKCYIQLLLSQFNRTDSLKCPFRFEELSVIFKAISDLSGRHDGFPLPSEIIRHSKINKSRFQKACLAIYGLPAQKIIQDLKMTQAFNKVVTERREIQDASSSLGYHHSANFITAFHNHFGLTPLEAIHLQAV